MSLASSGDARTGRGRIGSSGCCSGWQAAFTSAGAFFQNVAAEAMNLASRSRALLLFGCLRSQRRKRLGDFPLCLKGDRPKGICRPQPNPKINVKNLPFSHK
jgi:hypothetical protein